METQINPIFYSHHPHLPSSAFGLHLNPDNDIHEPEQVFINTDITTTEPMFHKALTPSDVGKLNRLVIPKQYAEKYFPLGGGGDAAGVHHQKGLLLCFEEESGKLWRFRYSYWNSSQSYVLTKGWCRYVKEKRLDAGDLVLFKRHSLDCGRMFIAWRRQSASAVPFNDGMAAAVAQPVDGGARTIPLPNLPDCLLHADAGDVYENVVNYQRREVATRRVRLFGVNLECPDESDNLYQDTCVTDDMPST